MESGSTLTTQFTTAIGTIQSDVMTYIGIGLGAALVIVGAIVAVKLGLRFFKSVAK